MKKALFILVLVGLVASVAVLLPVYAAAQEEKAAELPQVTGKVVTVDLNASSITIELPAAVEGSAPEQKTVVINDATDLKKAGAAAKLGDLAKGDEVTVVYLADEAGVMVAQSVTAK